MREILFRGKMKKDNTWCYGNLCVACGCKYIVSTRVFPLSIYGEADPETVGQFTGLLDRKGKKIFEGDIVKFREWSRGNMCWIGKVHYENQQFVVSGNPNKECSVPFLLCMSKFDSKDIEVIGNTYDNPDLLKE